MGLTSEDLELKQAITRFEPMIMDALSNAATRLTTPTGRMAAIRWIGADTIGPPGPNPQPNHAALRTAAIDTNIGNFRQMLTTMRSVMNAKTIKIGSTNIRGAGYRDIQRRPLLNGLAAMAPNGPVGLGDQLRTIGDVLTAQYNRQANPIVDDRHILMSYDYKTLNDFLPFRPARPRPAPNAPPPPPGLAPQPYEYVRHIDGNQVPQGARLIQSKLGAFIHELTHVLLGVDDYQFGPATFYGTANAQYLSRRRPLNAQGNAENWCIFIEALGHHNVP